MFKKFLSLTMLCLVSCFIHGEYIHVKANISDTKSNEEQYTIPVKLVKSPEFEKLVDMLSIELKNELDNFVDKGQKLFLDAEFIEFINRYKDLYSKFKKFSSREPMVTFLLSVEPENTFDFVKTDDCYERFLNTISMEELHQLESAKSKFEQLMMPKVEHLFIDLEKSNLNKELKEKSGNKTFRAFAIFS